MRPYLRLIALVGLIVPRRLRTDWRQEWEAELRYREMLLAEWDRLDSRHRCELLRRSLGAFWDALRLQPRRWEDEMFQDLRYGVRMLRTHKAFTVVAVLSLALGIGANTAIFTLVDTVLLRMLPVTAPEELYLVRHAGQRGGEASSNYLLYQLLREHNQSFSGLFVFNPNRWKVNTGGATEMVSGQVVTGNYFSVLGVNALLGRTLTAEDDKVLKGHPVAVISHRYWIRQFGQAPDALGKTITIEQTPFTIIGVTPPEFFGLQVGRDVDISVPMVMHPLVGSGPTNYLNDSEYWTSNLQIMGRLKPGATPEQARAEVDLLFRQFMAAPSQAWVQPQARKDFFERGELMPAGRGLAELRGLFTTPLRILTVVVALVLLISCANVANLLLARATTRQKEVAVRLALGAGRRRLVRQLLTESALLALLGGALGLLLATWGVNLLVSYIPRAGAPLRINFTPDARILGFTTAVSLLTALLFGLAPALRATKVALSPALKDDARGASGGSRLRLSKALVVAQVAMSLALLIGAGLFVRSLQKLRGVDTGVISEGVLLFTLDGFGTAYKDMRLTALHANVLERLSALPGVRSASLASATPIGGGGDVRRLVVPGFNHRPEVDDRIGVNWVGPQLFATLGMRLLAGRDFGPQDRENAPRVAVISEDVARYYFPNENPIGKQITVSRPPAGGEFEVIGVVNDANYSGPREGSMRMAYLPYWQSPPRPLMKFTLRTAGDPAGLVSAVRHQVQAVVPEIPLTDVKTLETMVDEALAQERLVATLSGFFGLLALLLACVGLYGVVAYAASRRTQEIGIRMALGARKWDVIGLVMRETMLLVVLGLLIGLAAAVATTRLIAGLLFGLTPTDPLTMALATLLLIAVAALAGWLPARRASRVDPMAALRHE